MKISTHLFCIVGTFFIFGCSTPHEPNAMAATPEELRELQIERVKSILEKRIVYHDSVLNKCYIYLWEEVDLEGNAARGGPALCEVDCDAVPKDILIIIE